MAEDPEVTDPRDLLKRRDIVAELDRWLKNEQEWMRVDSKWQHLIAKEVVQRARNEIVALRHYKHENHEASEVIRRAAELVRTQKEGAFCDAKREVRNAALEDAAQICELSAQIMQPDADEGRLSDAIAAVKSCAVAIRTLKAKGHA